METLINLFNLKGLLLAALIFIPIEQLLPLHKGQKIFRRAWLKDLSFALINAVVIGFGLMFVIILVVVTRDAFMPVGFLEAVASQPYWLQLVELIILADLGFYFMHRLFHTVPALWRFHAVHHSIEELDWLAGNRVHPVDQILTKGVSLIPSFGLGFSEWVIIANFAIYNWHSIMLHANIRIHFGPLRWIIASPEFHHWHHTNRREAYDKNFAGQISLLDVIFRTVHMPKGRKPGNYGIDSPMPDGYLANLFHPFLRKKRMAATKADAPEAVAPQTLQEG